MDAGPTKAIIITQIRIIVITTVYDTRQNYNSSKRRYEHSSGDQGTATIQTLRHGPGLQVCVVMVRSATNEWGSGFGVQGFEVQGRIVA